MTKKKKHPKASQTKKKKKPKMTFIEIIAILSSVTSLINNIIALYLLFKK